MPRKENQLNFSFPMELIEKLKSRAINNESPSMVAKRLLLAVLGDDSSEPVQEVDQDDYQELCDRLTRLEDFIMKLGQPPAQWTIDTLCERVEALEKTQNQSIPTPHEHNLKLIELSANADEKSDFVPRESLEALKEQRDYWEQESCYWQDEFFRCQGAEILLNTDNEEDPNEGENEDTKEKESDIDQDEEFLYEQYINEDNDVLLEDTKIYLEEVIAANKNQSSRSLRQTKKETILKLSRYPHPKGKKWDNNAFNQALSHFGLHWY